LKPEYAEAHSNKGVTLNELKRYDEALAHYDRALSLKPDTDWIYGDSLFIRMKTCSWSGMADTLENIFRKVSENERVINPFVMLAVNDNPLLNKKSSEIYIKSRHLENSVLGPIQKQLKSEKIRLGYFSPDFHTHPVAFLTSELFEIHDRDKFEVFAFSLQDLPIEDEVSNRLRQGFDRFIEAKDMSDVKVAQLARELKIDVAIDLSGLTQFSRTGIFSYRAAPVQVNWLGYPGTIGADFIDYIVADEVIIPERHQNYYKEKVVYLPDTYMVDDSKRLSSHRIFTRKECGLPENAFVFCCFNNDYKFNPQVLDNWSKILRDVKNSVLWLSENNKNFKANIVIEFEYRGIDPGRIIFAKRLDLMGDHLARYSLADIFLDTHPYNAHTTTIDSLKAGVPVITLMGQSFAGRVAASLLNAIGLPELVTNSQDDFVSLAVDMATSPGKLKNVREKLMQNQETTPLFNTPLFTENLERAYKKIMERYWADLAPEHIYL
jgi:predicted O-linked N-acetylglucosamine transferase (SPINDLY family)